jgi:hypothetical protein
MAAGAAVWLAGLLLVVLFSIISRRISLRGLLVDPATGRTSVFSRPQMLILALSGAGTYLATGLSTIATTGTLPPVPPELLAVVGGSQLVFVGSKAIAASLSKFRLLGAVP